MDNGAAENLTYGAKHLLTLANDMKVSEVVVPDVIGNANDTLALAQMFARYAESSFQYMFVLQGSSKEEVMFCLRALDNGNMFSYITTIGIPRHFHSIGTDFRLEITEFLIKEHFNDKFNIHFLGANAFMHEVYYLNETINKDSGFRGIDTSLPIYMGLENLDIFHTKNYIPRPADFFTRTDNNEEMIERNIKLYLHWASYNE